VVSALDPTSHHQPALDRGGSRSARYAVLASPRVASHDRRVGKGSRYSVHTRERRIVDPQNGDRFRLPPALHEL